MGHQISLPWEGKTQGQILHMLAPYVIDYCKWYCEHGLYLPGEYAANPAAWTEILRKIQYAFERDVSDTKETVKLEKRVEGLELFYKHIGDLWR